MEELVFQYLAIEVAVDKAFGPFNRADGTVAILLRDKNGRWALGHKSHFYPEGIVRMVGGGIDKGEHPADAAVRELHEETGVSIDPEKLVPLVHAELTGLTPELNSSIFVFYAQTYQEIRPADDVSQISQYADRDIVELVHRYENLPNTPIDDTAPATWANYGQIWGPVHAAALARVKDLGL